MAKKVGTKVGSILRKIVAKKRDPREGIGSPLLTASEVSKKTGGYVSTTDPRIPETFDPSSPASPPTGRGGSGGGSGGISQPSPTTIPTTSSRVDQSVSQTNKKTQSELRSNKQRMKKELDTYAWKKRRDLERDIKKGMDVGEANLILNELTKTKQKELEEELSKETITEIEPTILDTEISQVKVEPEFKIFNFGTRQDLAPISKDIGVTIAPPGQVIIEQRVTGSFKAKDGTIVPIVETFEIDERGGSRKLSREEASEVIQPELTIPEENKGTSKLQEKITQEGERQSRKGTIAGGAKGFGLGIASSVLGAGQFVEQLVTKPAQTIKAVPESIKESARGAKTLGSKLLSPTGVFTSGVLATEVALTVAGGRTGFKAIKTGTKINKLSGVSTKLKFTTATKGRISTKNLNKFEPEFNKLVEVQRITERRQFKIDIPNPQGKKVTLRVLEYVKDGQSKFIGEIVEGGKVTEIIKGISQFGEGGSFTRIVKARLKKRGFKDIEIKEFIDIIKSKTKGKLEGSKGELLNIDVNLLRKTTIKATKKKKLKAKDLKSIEELELQPFEKGAKPFTKQELSQAQKIGESTILTKEQLISLRKTKQKIDVLGQKIVKQEAVSVTVSPKQIKVAKQLTKNKAPISTGEVIIDTVTGKAKGIGAGKFIQTVKEPLKKTRTIEIPSIKQGGKVRKITKERLSKALDDLKSKIDRKTSKGKDKIVIIEELEKTIKRSEIKSDLDLTGIPRATGGKGLTPQQIKQFQGKVFQDEFIQQRIPSGSFSSIAEGVKRRLIGQSKRTALTQSTIGGLLISPKVLAGLEEKSSAVSLLKEKQVDLLKPGQETAIASKEIIAEGNLPRLFSGLVSKLDQKQKQVLLQRLKKAVRTKTTPRKAGARARKRSLPPPPPGSSKGTTRALDKISKRNESVDILIGLQKKKQRVLERNVAPRRALKKAQEYVDRNIEASFRLVRNKKKPKKKDIKKVKVSRKFTIAKTNPLFLKEKVKFRLDSPGEKQQIKRAKKK